MAGRESSVAPKERINIVYKPAIDMDEDVELPFKVLVMGDFTGRADDAALEDRKPINVDKDNFNEVLAGQKLSVDFNVKDRLSPDAQEGDEVPVHLQIKNIKDFQPEQVAQQVPELKSLLEIREALIALKSPISEKKDFVKKLKEILGDDAARQRLMKELKIEGGGE